MADTPIKTGDRLVTNAATWRVIDVVEYPDPTDRAVTLRTFMLEATLADGTLEPSRISERDALRFEASGVLVVERQQ